VSAALLTSDQVELDCNARVERERLEDIVTALNPDWMEDFEENLDLAVTTYRELTPTLWAREEAKHRLSMRDARDFAVLGGITLVTLAVLVVLLPLAWTLRLIHGR
jgi:hypothetical protein